MAKLAKIRVECTVRWSLFKKIESEGLLGKEEVEAALHLVLVAMMQEAMRWKRKCGMKGDNEVRVNQHGEVWCGPWQVL